jgi:hypothetical protein
MIGISPDACRLLEEPAAAGHKLLTSPWAVATARSNLAREPQVDIGAWTQRLQGFQLAEDHTHDPTLELPRQLLPLMTAALSAQADRFLTGDAGTRSLFPDGKFRSLKVLTLGEWLSELHTIPAISPSDPARPGIVEFSVAYTPRKLKR